MSASIAAPFPTHSGHEDRSAFGRLRPIHANGMLFGWLLAADMGLCYYLVPRLCLGGVERHVRGQQEERCAHQPQRTQIQVQPAMIVAGARVGPQSPDQDRARGQLHETVHAEAEHRHPAGPQGHAHSDEAFDKIPAHGQVLEAQGVAQFGVTVGGQLHAPEHTGWPVERMNLSPKLANLSPKLAAHGGFLAKLVLAGTVSLLTLVLCARA